MVVSNIVVPFNVIGISAYVFTAIIVARARTVAEPVVVVSHHTNANCTNSLPSSEKTCPVHTAKKGCMEAGFVCV